MANKPWIFEQIARGSEETFFHKREAELLAELRRKVASERKRKGLEEELDVHDERVLRALEEMGFTRDVLVLLHAIPLVQVAWSDGTMSPAERGKILELAATRGIVPGTPTYDRLLPLLERRPPDEAFDACTRVIRAMFSHWSEEERRTYETDLSTYAVAVARASGGVLGIGAISAKERAVLERISREIAEAHAEAAEAVVKDGAKR